MKTCLDDGSAGSLRQVVTSAQSGDIVDLSKLPGYCAGSDTADVTVTLSGVEIGTSRNDLTLQGPTKGHGSVAVSGGSSSRVLHHSGSGTLTLSNLTITDGQVEDADARGGCVLTDGNVTFLDSTVTGCNLVGSSAARGGGVSAYTGTARFLYSTVSNNTLTLSAGGTYASGAGIFARSLQLLYSTVTENRGFATSGNGGGGASVGIGTAFVHASTVDHNQFAGGSGGALQAWSDVTISDSTISYNSSNKGPLSFLGQSHVVIASSSIAFNHAEGDPNQTSAIDLHVATFSLENSIVAMNTTGPSNLESDLHSASPLAAPALSGSHNVVREMSVNITAPPGFATDVDPMLGPLIFNGGPTRTHALVIGSPAIGAGGPPSPFIAYDQRGLGHPRSTKTSAGTVTDIGAYGYETIFADGLD